ncbi:MAG: phytanoyl-CoA dioxygenase family protein [Betaproteobacteria bacterium]|nr:phytanoyl-CoA dioxygenase family protein [Betaproteobacteria bacterium]
MVTQQQLADFARDGFLVLRGMYDADEVAQMQAWVERLAHTPPAFGKEMAYYEDSLSEPGRRILCRIEKFADPDMPFAAITGARKMLDVTDALQGGPSVLFKEKINFKLPGGGGFEPHQDIQPGWDDYAPYFLSVCIAIDANTVENGCLELAAGHHKRGWLGERMKPLTPAQLAGVEFVACPMQPGDVAFFDCYAPHQSAPNRTDSPRRNVYLTYNRAADGDHRERYFADKRANFPPDNEREAGKEYRYRV